MINVRRGGDSARFIVTGDRNAVNGNYRTGKVASFVRVQSGIYELCDTFFQHLWHYFGTCSVAEVQKGVRRGHWNS